MVEHPATAKILRLGDAVDLSVPAVRREALTTLEGGGIVVLLDRGFQLTVRERELMANGQPLISGIKEEEIRDGKPTIIYEPWRQRIRKRRYAHARGPFARTEIQRDIRTQLEAMMARFGTWAATLVAELLPSYPPVLIHDRITYRPHERSALQPLHIDSSYGYPTQGRGMFRLFCNVDPANRPRRWQVGEPFEPFARRFIGSVRLRDPRGLEFLRRRLQLGRNRRSAYDDVIAELRRLGKSDPQYQGSAPREIVEFPSGSCWLAMTDLVLHGAVSGRHSLDQTFFLPATGMTNPWSSSLYILERLMGRALA